jgi:hypothetical protein
MRKWSCACLGWELFVVMIVTGAFDVEHESKVFFSTNTEVVPNESWQQIFSRDEGERLTLIMVSIYPFIRLFVPLE